MSQRMGTAVGQVRLFNDPIVRASVVSTAALGTSIAIVNKAAFVYVNSKWEESKAGCLTYPKLLQYNSL